MSSSRSSEQVCVATRNSGSFRLAVVEAVAVRAVIVEETFSGRVGGAVGYADIRSLRRLHLRFCDGFYCSWHVRGGCCAVMVAYDTDGGQV